MVAASAIGILLAGALWWVYFDVIALVAERALGRSEGTAQAKLGRDAFSYLHLPMVAGIVVAALGLKKTLEYVGGGEHHSWTDPLTGLPGWALPIGVGLFVLAQIGFRLRIGKPLSLPCVVAVLALVGVGLVGPPCPRFRAGPGHRSDGRADHLGDAHPRRGAGRATPGAPHLRPSTRGEAWQVVP